MLVAENAADRAIVEVRTAVVVVLRVVAGSVTHATKGELLMVGIAVSKAGRGGRLLELVQRWGEEGDAIAGKQNQRADVS